MTRRSLPAASAEAGAADRALLQLPDPVRWDEDWQAWFVTRHEDVAKLLRDPRLSLGGGTDAMFQRLSPQEQVELDGLRRHISMWVGALDPDEHARLRGVLHKAFKPLLLDELRGFVRRTARELLLPHMRERQLDLVARLAEPLPAMVIARLLGAPSLDWDRFGAWSRALTEFLGYGVFDAEIMRRAQSAVEEMTGYLESVIDERREAPHQNDLIGNLLAIQAAEGGITDEEILANCVLMLFAGHETTTLLLGNTVLLLLQNREQLELLRRRRELIPDAVQESLRCESPVRMVRRSAVESFELRGHRIGRGDFVWLDLAAANRDPSEFEDPGSYDIRRDHRRHLAYGMGPHYCLGAALSNLEGEAVVETLLELLPGLRLADREVTWRDHPTARMLDALWVEW